MSHAQTQAPTHPRTHDYVVLSCVIWYSLMFCICFFFIWSHRNNFAESITVFIFLTLYLYVMCASCDVYLHRIYLHRVRFIEIYLTKSCLFVIELLGDKTRVLCLKLRGLLFPILYWHWEFLYGVDMPRTRNAYIIMYIIYVCFQYTYIRDI